MSGFLNKDRFTVTRVDPVRWKLANQLTWRGHYADQVDVEAGFVTDFATVPWFVQWLIPRTGTWTLAAVAHDKLCNLLNDRHGLVQEYRRILRGGYLHPQELIYPVPCVFGPVDTDGAFRAMMEDECVDPIRRWLIWTGVRWGALANGARRVGWWRTAHLVLPVSVAVLAVLVGSVVGISWVVAKALGWT